MKAIKNATYLMFCLTPFLLSGQTAVIGHTASVLPDQGICAHRGASETHPENTIAAFEEAIRLGAQMIEFDVRMTKDNELVVMHDETIDRTTNGTGYVHRLTLEEISAFDAGSWKSDFFTGEKVPTLKEVLEIMPDHIWLNVHLKGGKKLGRETAKLIVAENRVNQSVVACEKKAARGLQQIEPDLKICTMDRLSSREKYVVYAIKGNYPFIQLKKSRNATTLARDVARLKKNYIRINYVQADTEGEIGELFDLGVDFIFTDHLAPMLAAFKKYRSEPINSTKN